MIKASDCTAIEIKSHQTNDWHRLHEIDETAECLKVDVNIEWCVAGSI